MRAVAAARTVGRSRVFKILHLDECPASPMEPGRGEQIKLINSRLGTEKVDVHLNRLVAGGPRGKRHHHTTADNVYIVKRGEGTLTVDGETHVIRENDVVYIPAGMTHSLPKSQRQRVRDFRNLRAGGAAVRFRGGRVKRRVPAERSR
jgi:mannose-6-phosphate isomerase-like protein (cupin superfamily)